MKYRLMLHSLRPIRQQLTGLTKSNPYQGLHVSMQLGGVYITLGNVYHVILISEALGNVC